MWDRNPDLKHGMVFYLGLPIAWPDRSIFGTICVLDIRTNEQAITYTNLLTEFRDVVESDLKYLIEVSERKAAQQKLQRRATTWSRGSGSGRGTWQRSTRS